MNALKKMFLPTRMLASLCLLIPSLVIATEPAPLNPLWQPVPTRVETSGDQRIIHFGEREYRLSPAKANQRGEMRQPLQGDMTFFSSYSKPASWQQRQVSTFVGNDGFELVWLLPGFGLVLGNTLSSGEPLLYLLRGQDGVLNPPVPGASWSQFRPLVFRLGAANGDLQAERTLLVFGSHNNYTTTGMGAKAVATPLSQPPVAAAWLFDREGVVQQWSPLKSLTPARSSQDVDVSVHTKKYVRTSASGQILFATTGKNDTLDVHVLSPDMKPLRTITGVREFVQQTEKPFDKTKQRGAYGYWNNQFVNLAQIGGYPTENHDVYIGSLTSVLLAPLAGMDGWYRVLGDDGRLSVPGNGIALKPLTRQRTAKGHREGIAPVDYTLAYGYLVAYRAGNDVRYGWASPQLSTHTGPIWRNALLMESERPDELRPTINTGAQMLVAQLDSGEWQAYAEPKVHIDLSTFLEPNTFSGYLPPAATPQQAAFLAEEVIIALGKEINKGNMAVQSSTLAHMRQENQAYEQARRQEQARKEAFWRMVIEGVTQGIGAVEVGPVTGGPQPSALGPNYYWEGGRLWHRPSGREVK